MFLVGFAQGILPGRPLGRGGGRVTVGKTLLVNVGAGAQPQRDDSQVCITRTLLVARTLLGAPGLTTRSKKLPGTRASLLGEGTPLTFHSQKGPF